MGAEHRPGDRPILGREHELAAIDGLISSVRRGLGGALVLRGEAGIGKSALLGCAATSANDLGVVPILGVRSEMSLGFAALHQLLNPF